MFEELTKLGFELEEDNNDLLYYKFKRQKGKDLQILLLEDHTWEKEEDFDPDHDIGDWLVFSYCPNDTRDYFGHFVALQYPLSLGEMKAISLSISKIEEERQKRLSRKAMIDILPVLWYNNFTRITRNMQCLLWKEVVQGYGWMRLRIPSEWR